MIIIELTVPAEETSLMPATEKLQNIHLLSLLAFRKVGIQFSFPLKSVARDSLGFLLSSAVKNWDF